jgi:hypothetical protein
MQGLHSGEMRKPRAGGVSRQAVKFIRRAWLRAAAALGAKRARPASQPSAKKQKAGNTVVIIVITGSAPAAVHHHLVGSTAQQRSSSQQASRARRAKSLSLI